MMRYFPILRNVLAASVFFALNLLVGRPIQAQEGPDLLAPFQGEPSEMQRIHLNRIKSLPTTDSLALFKIDSTAILEKTDQLTLSLFSNKPIIVDSTKVERHDANTFSWHGRIDHGKGFAILVIKNGAVTGQVRTGSEFYKIYPLGEGVHTLLRIDQSKLLEEGEPLEPLLNDRTWLPDSSSEVGHEALAQRFAVGQATT